MISTFILLLTEYSGKVAARELDGLRAYYEWIMSLPTVEVRVPLMALIDYR